jgi:ubiquinone/menaquinone biosynthesis C-methylase UbiE
MKVLDQHTKFAHLGKPGSAFSKGFQRRLDIITGFVDFKDKKILDLGCGEGVWLSKFAEFSSPENVFGSEYDAEQVEMLRSLKLEARSHIPAENIHNCPGEKLDFPDNFFDIVFQNEVLEHVQDDVQTLRECFRVLKPGGKLIMFTPNSGWPFETHGMFWNGKYYWGNIPFLPWLQKSRQKKFAPHVRNYTDRELRFKIQEAAGEKIRNSKFEIRNKLHQPEADSPLARTTNHKPQTTNYKLTYHKHVFPGFDGAVRRFGFFGKLLQGFFFTLEKTPLNWFGISHLVVVEKV